MVSPCCFFGRWLLPTSSRDAPHSTVCPLTLWHLRPLTQPSAPSPCGIFDPSLNRLPPHLVASLTPHSTVCPLTLWHLRPLTQPSAPSPCGIFDPSLNRLPPHLVASLNRLPPHLVASSTPHSTVCPLTLWHLRPLTQPSAPSPCGLTQPSAPSPCGIVNPSLNRLPPHLVASSTPHSTVCPLTLWHLRPLTQPSAPSPCGLTQPSAPSPCGIVNPSLNRLLPHLVASSTPHSTVCPLTLWHRQPLTQPSAPSPCGIFDPSLCISLTVHLEPSLSGLPPHSAQLSHSHRNRHTGVTHVC